MLDTTVANPRVVVDGVKTSAFIDSGAQYSIGNLALMRAARIAPATDPDRPTRMEGIVGGAVAGEAVNSEILTSTPCSHLASPRAWARFSRASRDSVRFSRAWSGWVGLSSG